MRAVRARDVQLVLVDSDRRLPVCAGRQPCMESLVLCAVRGVRRVAPGPGVLGMAPSVCKRCCGILPAGARVSRAQAAALVSALGMSRRELSMVDMPVVSFELMLVVA